MRKLILSIAVTAIAFWITDNLVPGVSVTAYMEGEFSLAATYVIIAAVFGVVNTILGTIIKIVSFPIYILTLGFFSLIVNAALLWITAWVTKNFLGFGLTIDTFFWTGIIAAVVLALVNWVISIVLKPVL